MFLNCTDLGHDYNYVIFIHGNLSAYYLYTGKRGKWGGGVHDSRVSAISGCSIKRC